MWLRLWRERAKHSFPSVGVVLATRVSLTAGRLFVLLVDEMVGHAGDVIQTTRGSVSSSSFCW